MQNDMKAIRMVIRLGWDIFNPLNAINEDEATRFPFAVYVPSSGAGAFTASYENGKFLDDDFPNDEQINNEISEESTKVKKK